jgi:hypothetical protein
VGDTVGGSADVEGVVPGPVRDGLSPPRRASRVTAGCEASGNKPKGRRSIRGPQARRRPAGRLLPGLGGGEAAGVMGELREPPLMPRESAPRRWDVPAGPQGLAVGKRRVPAGE